eukprot:XP_001692362.1 predicted protein [Chlamydomonas reinhardtii]
MTTEEPLSCSKIRSWNITVYSFTLKGLPGCLEPSHSFWVKEREGEWGLKCLSETFSHELVENVPGREEVSNLLKKGGSSNKSQKGGWICCERNCFLCQHKKCQVLI